MIESQDSKRSDTGLPGEETNAPAGADMGGTGLAGWDVTDVLPIGVIVLDKDAAIVHVNAYCRTIAASEDFMWAEEGDRSGWTLPGNLAEQVKGVIDSGGGQMVDGSEIFRRTHERFRVYVWPLGNPGACRGCVLTIEDRSELVELRKQAADADRLAALGNLASKVAHELNNPLDGILRYVNLAIRTVEEHGLEKPREYLGQCRRGLMRMVQIVSELLEFSRRTYASLETAGVEKVTEEALRTLESRIEAQGVRLVRDYGHVPAQVSSRNLFQVFCNIAKNALDAMPDGGVLTVSTSITGGMVIVKFRDTGAGFAPANAQTMFEPFYTTKREGKGTGLGLAICKDIVERQRGRISAENAPDGGSIFTVWLPDRSDLKGGL